MCKQGSDKITFCFMKEQSPKRLEEHKNDESSASLQVSDNSDRNKNTVKWFKLVRW